MCVILVRVASLFDYRERRKPPPLWTAVNFALILSEAGNTFRAPIEWRLWRSSGAFIEGALRAGPGGILSAKL